MKKVKRLKSLLALLPSLAIIASALTVVCKIFYLPSKVEANTTRIIKLEQDKVATEKQLRHNTELLTEMMADIKRLLTVSRVGEK